MSGFELDTAGVNKLNEASGKVSDLAKSLEGDKRQAKALDALESIAEATNHLRPTSNR